MIYYMCPHIRCQHHDVNINGQWLSEQKWCHLTTFTPYFKHWKKIRKTISSNIYLIIHMRFWIQNIYWFENSSILYEMFLLKTENSLLSFKSMVYLAIQTDGKLKVFFQIHFIHFNSCWNQMEQSSFKQ